MVRLGHHRKLSRLRRWTVGIDKIDTTLPARALRHLAPRRARLNRDLPACDSDLDPVAARKHEGLVVVLECDVVELDAEQFSVGRKPSDPGAALRFHGIAVGPWVPVDREGS
jgi:hypothetical protein